MKICILGHTGFVGSAVYKLLQTCKEHTVFGVNTQTQITETNFDVLVNCAGFAKKHIANKYPYVMSNTENSIFETINILKFKTLIHISSIDAGEFYMYGAIKRDMELRIVSRYEQAIILRLGGLIGDGLKKNVIFDIVNNHRLFVTRDSIYNYIPTSEVANIILHIINHPIKGVINIASSKSISVEAIAYLLKKDVDYGYKKETYEIDVSRLQSFYPIKTSEHYIKEYYERK